ncbi:MAG: methionine biosynthesis protein MetW [Verrucomicrobia bacterium]|nr:methionine biosynthesis protein MetW [Verrucomicrobiota bacterium]MBU1908675.1 methionine biosynthesis protein MetW [Verrucomicrobiota bacterium]
MPKSERLDFDTIVGFVTEGARVLDMGCGDGTLLERLAREKKASVRGVELSEDNVRACIGRGLSVRHGNIEEGLADYRDGAFDFVILSQTLAYLDAPARVVKEMLRVGGAAIISFDNAGHWRRRCRALRGGGMGQSLLSGEPRERAITIPQFNRFTREIGARVRQTVYLTGQSPIHRLRRLRATAAVYVISK